MFYELHPFLPKDIVYVDKVGVACIGHAMVRHKDDVHNLSEIPRHQLIVQVLCKRVYISERLLYITNETSFPRGKAW